MLSAEKSPVEDDGFLITTPTRLARLVTDLADQPRIALDTEADSFYSYFEKTCLIQVAIPGQEFVIDPLALRDLSALGPILADPHIEKVFHAAEYDIMILKRDFGFSFANIFDTMVASKVLGYRRCGLAALVQELLGITLDKRLQRADWGRRPLTPQLLNYARQDVRYLLDMRRLLGEQLSSRGRWPRALEEFQRLTQVVWNRRGFDPEGYQRLPGAESLDDTARAVLRELYLARDAEARRHDVPPFRILSDTALLALSQSKPTHPDDLERLSLPGFSGPAIAKNRGWILAAVRRGLQSPPQPFYRACPGLRYDEAERERFKALRRWRREQSAKEGVDPEVIIPRRALSAIAHQPPRTLEELAAISGLGPWTLNRYGQQILEVLKG